jgi:thiol oxidase
MAPAARLLALGAVAVLVIAASRGADALRSLGAGTTVAEGDAAVDLNVTNFDAFLAASREPFAVVEFFAHWSDSSARFRVFSPSVRASALRFESIGMLILV